MTLWLYKRVIIFKIIYAAIAWWDGIYMVWAGMPAEGRMHYDHRGSENHSKKNAEDVFGSANTWNSGRGCSTNGSIPSTEAESEKPKNRVNSELLFDKGPHNPDEHIR